MPIVRRFALPLVLLAAFATPGCGAAPPVRTSAGILVPASTVQAQDTAADILKLIKDSHNEAVRIHDSLVATDPPEVHSAHRRILLESAGGLHGAYQALAAWKAASTAAPADEILTPLFGSVKALLDLATQLGAISPADYDRIRRFLP